MAHRLPADLPLGGITEGVAKKGTGVGSPLPRATLDLFSFPPDTALSLGARSMDCKVGNNKLPLLIKDTFYLILRAMSAITFIILGNMTI